MGDEILVIEDSEPYRAVFTEILTNAGFRVTQAALASGALGLLATWTPDLIVLDLGMPPGEMGGLEFLARLRESDRWQSVPVVILSGVGELMNPDVVARLRVDAALSKQLRVADVVEEIRRILRDRLKSSQTS